MLLIVYLVHLSLALTALARPNGVFRIYSGQDPSRALYFSTSSAPVVRAGDKKETVDQTWSIYCPENPWNYGCSTVQNVLTPGRAMVPISLVAGSNITAQPIPNITTPFTWNALAVSGKPRHYTFATPGGLYLTYQGHRAAVTVEQKQTGNTTAQEWILEVIAPLSATYQIGSIWYMRGAGVIESKSLDVPSTASIATYAAGNTAQHWNVNALGSGLYTIRNSANGGYLGAQKNYTQVGVTSKTVPYYWAAKFAGEYLYLTLSGTDFALTFLRYRELKIETFNASQPWYYGAIFSPALPEPLSVAGRIDELLESPSLPNSLPFRKVLVPQ
ncbi:hypothetical protein EXIGLDRAFT_763948 [Exidia glandulosa HHB12029]|uniref:Ricin B lectin domain-containing protein n=1 Tax=Exidia glandulosa HHB12029 TaxID=1314781 RepID=A0A165LIS9_EXIGL|nr:hypothetical protein EXIGLDRAFT_763948 [Exidia glandulosa HHB12029]